MGDANVRVPLDRPLEVSQGFFRVIAPPSDVAKICPGLSLAWIYRQLALERGFCVLVLMHLPEQETEPEIDVGLAGRGLGSCPELFDRFRSPPQTIESLPEKYVS